MLCVVIEEHAYGLTTMGYQSLCGFGVRMSWGHGLGIEYEEQLLMPLLVSCDLCLSLVYGFEIGVVA